MSQYILQDMKNFSTLLTEELNRILPKASSQNHLNTLYSAMRYTTLAPAKHLRPFLVFASSQIFNVTVDRSLPVCVAVELAHVYSLIHDDLPAIDNDNIRRNQPSCHKKFNEAIAILTGNSLLTLSFELLSKLKESSDDRCKMINILSQNLGYNGMIGGQVLDTTTSNTNLENITKIQIMKTSKLFSASCALGGVLGNAKDNEILSLTNYGQNLGCAFQINDDIEDLKKDNLHNNLANIIGIEKAKNQMNTYINQAIKSLENLPHQTSPLHDLANLIRGS